MWIVFRDPLTAFNHVDKFVVDLVEDNEILTYQAQMGAGRAYDIMFDVYFLQQFFSSKDDVEYFVRRYKTWPPSPSK